MSEPVRARVMHGRVHRLRGPMYRLADLTLPPSLVSLVRVPLGVCFIGRIGDARAALSILLLAGATDVLDGFIARTFGWETSTGAIVDAVADKLFMACVVIGLVVAQRLHAPWLLLLFTREAGELLLLSRLLWATKAQPGPPRAHRANRLGKMATVLQFATIVAAVLGSPWLRSLLWACGIGGMLAAVGYAVRERRVPLGRAR